MLIDHQSAGLESREGESNEADELHARSVELAPNSSSMFEIKESEPHKDEKDIKEGNIEMHLSVDDNSQAPEPSSRRLRNPHHL